MDPGKPTQYLAVALRCTVYGHFGRTRRDKHPMLTCPPSRVALKKYILANNKGVSSGTAFDSQFNRAVKAGVDQGIFAQPKGMF